MASNADQYPGTAHGKVSPLRWDPATASAVIVLGALAFLVFVNYAFAGSASVSASARR